MENQIIEFREDIDKEGIGERLKDSRLSLNLDQPDVEQKIGYAYKTMSRLERGKRFPAKFLYRYCMSTGISLDYLYGTHRYPAEKGQIVMPVTIEVTRRMDRLDSIREALAPEDRARFEDYLYNIAKDLTYMADGRLHFKTWIRG